MTAPALAVQVARLELELEQYRKRVELVEAVLERVLVEQRAHRGRMDAALEQIRRRNGTPGR